LKFSYFLDKQLIDREAAGLKCRIPFTPRKIPGIPFCSIIMQLERLHELKNPITSSGIKPMTLQVVAYCLNHVIA
jgi:hypothetical protein